MASNFLAASRRDASSRGLMKRAFITAGSMPSPFRRSAASRALETIAPMAMTATPLPPLTLSHFPASMGAIAPPLSIRPPFSLG